MVSRIKQKKKEKDNQEIIMNSPHTIHCHFLMLFNFQQVIISFMLYVQNIIKMSKDHQLIKICSRHLTHILCFKFYMIIFAVNLLRKK